MELELLPETRGHHELYLSEPRSCRRRPHELAVGADSRCESWSVRICTKNRMCHRLRCCGGHPMESSSCWLSETGTAPSPCPSFLQPDKNRPASRSVRLLQNHAKALISAGDILGIRPDPALANASELADARAEAKERRTQDCSGLTLRRLLFHVKQQRSLMRHLNQVTSTDSECPPFHAQMSQRSPGDRFCGGQTSNELCSYVSLSQELDPHGLTRSGY